LHSILTCSLSAWHNTGVRRQCADRLAEISKGSAEEQAAAKEAMVEELKSMPIAVQQGKECTYVPKHAVDAALHLWLLL
jgi:hypothetical protein